eukprot:jgi/Mesvir1/13644/Mv02977-RA.1
MECLTRLLSEVPSWNADIIDEETREVQKTVPYLKELLKAYFAATGGIKLNKRQVMKSVCECVKTSRSRKKICGSSYTPTMSLTPLMLDVVKVLTLHMSIAMAAAHSAGGGLAKPLKEKKFWVSFGFQSAALALFWMLLVPNL